MTAAERQRLARILGMLGSDHAGERAAAALQAEAFRKRHGLTWEAMLALPSAEPPPQPARPEPPAPPPVDPAKTAWSTEQQQAEQPKQAPPGTDHPRWERSPTPKTSADRAYDVWVTSGLCLVGLIVFGITVNIVQAFTR